MPVTYPGSGVTITVEALLKQPRLIVRALADLATKRFVADRVFTRGTSDQVAGGAALFQRSESIFASGPVEEVGVRAEYPRASWTEAIFAAAVQKFGLEVPISDETQRRNQLDVVARGFRKISNSLVSFVDALAMTLLQDTTQGVQTFAASGSWAVQATDIISDFATARGLIANLDEGYLADTLIVNPAQETAMLVDQDIRNSLPRENGASPFITGRAMPLMGFRQILVTNSLPAGTFIVMESGIAGTIADEDPLPGEGYTSYNPNQGGYNANPALQDSGQQASIYVKQYRNDNKDETIIRGARFPAMWLAEPKAVVKGTGA